MCRHVRFVITHYVRSSNDWINRWKCSKKKKKKRNHVIVLRLFFMKFFWTLTWMRSEEWREENKNLTKISHAIDMNEQWLRTDRRNEEKLGTEQIKKRSFFFFVVFVRSFHSVLLISPAVNNCLWLFKSKQSNRWNEQNNNELCSWDVMRKEIKIKQRKKQKTKSE